MEAPAIFAIFGLHTPQQIITYSAEIFPLAVCNPITLPSSTSTSVISVWVKTDNAPISLAASRIIVPARSESTTPTVGLWNPPMMTSVLIQGNNFFTSSGVTNEASIPQALAEAMRRFSSSIRSGFRASSIPPLSLNTPNSLYCAMLSSVSWVMTFEWSSGNMKFEAWPVLPPGLGRGPLSIIIISFHPSLAR